MDTTIFQVLIKKIRHKNYILLFEDWLNFELHMEICAHFTENAIFTKYRDLSIKALCGTHPLKFWESYETSEWS